MSEAPPRPSPTAEKFEWRGALILFGVLFLGVSDTQLIPPLLPSIAADLATPPGRTGIIVTVYALAAAAFALLVGAASDRFGRRRLMLLALAVFSGASVLTYASSYFSTLIAARMLTGLGAGALSTLSLSYAGDLYAYRHRGRAMGVLSMAYFLAFVIAIPAGAMVTARFGWRFVFLGLALAGLAMLAVAAVGLPPMPRPAGARERGGVREHFRRPDRLAGIVAAFLTSGGLVGFLTYVGVWLSGQGVGVEKIGLLFVTAGVAATAVAPLAGWLADRLGKLKIIVTANLLLAFLFLGVATLPWGVALFLGVSLLSLTASARQAPLHALTTEFAGAGARGSYVAVRNAASQLGIAAVAALSALAFDRAGFLAVAGIAAFVTLLIPAACLWMKEPAGGADVASPRR